MHSGFIRKYTILFLLTFLGYFSEVCIMPYVKIFGVTPNLLYAVIGIVTVAYGKLRVFWVGLIYGISGFGSTVVKGFSLVPLPPAM